MSVIWHAIERDAKRSEQARCPECNRLAGDWANQHEVGCAKGLRDAMDMVNVTPQYGAGLQNANVSTTRKINNSVTLARKPRRRCALVILAVLALYGAWLAWVLR